MHAIEELHFWGRSMGAVTALLLAGSYPRSARPVLASLVLDSPFTKLLDMVQDVATLQLGVPGFVASLAMQFVAATVREKIAVDIRSIKPINCAQKLKLPVAFIAAKKDNMVPPVRMKAYFDQYYGKQKVLIQSDTEHNEEREMQAVCQAQRFLVNVFGQSEIEQHRPEPCLARGESLRVSQYPPNESEYSSPTVLRKEEEAEVIHFLEGFKIVGLDAVRSERSSVSNSGIRARNDYNPLSKPAFYSDNLETSDHSRQFSNHELHEQRFQFPVSGVCMPKTQGPAIVAASDTNSISWNDMIALRVANLQQKLQTGLNQTSPLSTSLLDMRIIQQDQLPPTTKPIHNHVPPVSLYPKANFAGPSIFQVNQGHQKHPRLEIPRIPPKKGIRIFEDRTDNSEVDEELARDAPHQKMGRYTSKLRTR